METKQSNNSATPMADAVKIANQRALFSLEWENDTVFKKRELNYKTKAAFQKDLEAGKISKYTTVFIKDSKEIYKNGQYYGAGSSSEETSDVIINIDSTDSYTGTLSGITYNEIVNCIKRNGSIKVRINIDGMDSIFTPTSCIYIEESSTVLISIDISAAASNIYTQIFTFTISNDNSYVISSVNKSIIGDISKIDGDITIGVSYVGIEGQQGDSSSNIILKKTGDGTKALTDGGTYQPFASEAPTDGNIYGRKDNQWEKMIKQKVVTESEYSALGSTANTDGILYFVTPD